MGYHRTVKRSKHRVFPEWERQQYEIKKTMRRAPRNLPLVGRRPPDARMTMPNSIRMRESKGTTRW